MTDLFISGVLEKAMDYRDLNIFQVSDRALLEKIEKKTDIGRVRPDRVFGKASLGYEMMQEEFSDRGKLISYASRFDRALWMLFLQGHCVV